MAVPWLFLARPIYLAMTSCCGGMNFLGQPEGLAAGGEIDGDLDINGDVIIDGDLDVTGTITATTIIVENDLQIVDPLIGMGLGNVADNLNLGLYWQYVNAGSKYGGFIRDRTTKLVRLFKDAASVPTTSTAISSLTKADIEVDRIFADTAIVGVGANSYIFPPTRATATQVLTDPLGTGNLDWKTPAVSAIIWRPGGITAGNTYATWPEVVTVVGLQNGEVTIYVDTSLGAAVITSPLDGKNRVTIAAGLESAGAATPIAMAADVQLTNIFSLTGPMGFTTNAQTVPALIFSSGSIFTITSGVTISQDPASLVPPIQIADNEGMIFVTTLGANLGSGAITPYFQLGSTSQLILATVTRTNPAPWFGNEISGPADAQIIWLYDASGPVLTLPNFFGSLVPIPIDNADHITYADAGLPSIGTTVEAALNTLKAIPLSPQPNNIVYQPGGTTGNGIYASWADIVTLVNSANVPLTIFIDSSITNPAPLNVDCDCRQLVTLGSVHSNTVGDTAELSTDLKLLDLAGITGPLELITNCATIGGLPLTGGAVFTLQKNAKVTQGGATLIASIVQNPGDVHTINTYDSSSFIVGAVPAVSLASGSQVTWNTRNTTVAWPGNEFAGPADSTITRNVDASAPQITLPGFLGTLTTVLLDASENVSYADTTSPSLGTVVSTALDNLNTRKYQEHDTPLFTNTTIDGGVFGGDAFLALTVTDELFPAYVSWTNTIGPNLSWKMGLENSLVPYDLTLRSMYTGNVAWQSSMLADITSVKELRIGIGGVTFYTFPTARGTAAQVLTDVLGNGVVSWQAAPAPGPFDQVVTINRPLNSQSALVDFTLAGGSQWTMGTRPIASLYNWALFEGVNPRLTASNSGEMEIRPSTTLNLFAPTVTVQSPTPGTLSTLRVASITAGAGDEVQVELMRAGVAEYQLRADVNDSFLLNNLIDVGGPKTVLSIDGATSVTSLAADLKLAGSLQLSAVAAPAAPPGTDGVLYKIAADDGLYWRTAGFGPVNIVELKKYVSFFKANNQATTFPGLNTFVNWTTSAGGMTMAAFNDAGDWSSSATPDSFITYLGARTFQAKIDVVFAFQDVGAIPSARTFRLQRSTGVPTTIVGSEVATGSNTMVSGGVTSTMSCITNISTGMTIQPQVGSDGISTTSCYFYNFTINITEIGP